MSKKKGEFTTGSFPIVTSPKNSNKISPNASQRNKSKNVKDAMLLAQWSGQAFNFELWLKEFEEGELPSDDDKHQNKLWAIEQSLDAALRLFKENDVPIPQAFSALRLDLYEALRGRKTTYFISAGRSNVPMPMMVLKAHTVAAVELLKQAGEKELDISYRYIAKLLKKHGLDLKEITDRDPPYLVIRDWRKSIFRNDANKYVRSICEGNIDALGGKDKSVVILKENACGLIEKASKLFPDLLKKV